MFYFLAVLTLLSTILFYSFYPRSDGLKTVDKPWARTSIADMVVQHNAVLNAARVVIYDETEHKNKMAYTTDDWKTDLKNNAKDYNKNDTIDDDDKKTGYATPPLTLYKEYLPSTYIYEDTTNNRGHEAIHTKIWCIKNDQPNYTDTYNALDVDHCGHFSQDATYPLGSTDLLVTYVDNNLNEESWAVLDSYLKGITKRSLGETVFLTKYTSDKYDNSGKKTEYEEHLKTMCGFVDCSVTATGDDVDPYGTCMLNNTRYLTIRIPRYISCDKEDKTECAQFMCITRLGATYDENNKIIYPQKENAK